MQCIIALQQMVDLASFGLKKHTIEYEKYL